MRATVRAVHWAAHLAGRATGHTMGRSMDRITARTRAAGTCRPSRLQLERSGTGKSLLVHGWHEHSLMASVGALWSRWSELCTSSD